MFFRVTQAGPYRYLHIARSYRDGQRVRQQTMVSLGRLDLLQASGSWRICSVRACDCANG